MDIRFFEKGKEEFKRYFYQKNITERIVFVISVLIIVIIVSFVTSIFFIQKHQLEETTSVSVKKDQEMVLEKLEMFFEKVENDAVSILAGENCQTLLSNMAQFLDGDSVKQHERYTLMQNILNSYIGQKSEYSAIAFYDLDVNCYADERFVVSDENIEEHMQRIREFLEGSENAAVIELHKSPWKLAKEDSYGDCISYVRKVYDMNSGKLIGLVEIEILNSEISKLYETVTGSQTTIYFEFNGCIIQAEKEELLYQKLAEEKWYQKWQRQAASGAVQMVEDYAAWYFITDYEDVGWHIISEVSKATYVSAIAQYGVLMAVLGVLIFIVSFFLVRFFATSITKPLSKITRTMIEIGQGDYDKRVVVKDGGEIGILAYEFNRMVDKTEKLLQESIEREEKKRKSELSLLQMQMTPHFFYNILESICGLIIMDEKKMAIHTIQLLSAFYRGVLNHGQEIISVERELEIGMNYLEIMKICYPDKFDYTIECDTDAKHSCVCKLTLQPLLENAIHHGFQHMKEKGRITIRVLHRDSEVILEVQDNGMGIDEKMRERVLVEDIRDFKMESFGLRNTDDRIKLYFGAAYGVEILPADQGTRIRIHLPYRLELTE